MVLLIIILLISTGDGHGGKASAVIQQGFNGHSIDSRRAYIECIKVKDELDLAYGSQVVSSKCVSSY
jgi:hypothetical protein